MRIDDDDVLLGREVVVFAISRFDRDDFAREPVQLHMLRNTRPDIDGDAQIADRRRDVVRARNCFRDAGSFRFSRAPTARWHSSVLLPVRIVVFCCAVFREVGVFGLLAALDGLLGEVAVLIAGRVLTAVSFCCAAEGELFDWSVVAFFCASCGLC